MSIGDSVRGIFGSPTKEVIQELSMRSGIGDVKTMKSAEESLKRVSPIDLETIYIREGMVFNWINKVTESFMSSDFRINTSNEREKKIMDAFVSACDFRELLKTTVQHVLIYGNAFWEMMTNDGPKLLGVDWIDPKSMDVKRTPMGKIIYDADGHPIAYVQYVKWDVDTSKVPKERLVDQRVMFPWQSGKGILLKREEVVQFHLHTVGDSWWGVGLIEPIYNLVMIKQNAETGFAEAIQRVAYPRVWVGVGDQQHPPTQEQIDDVYNQLQGLETRHQFVAPYYYNPQILESKRVDRLSQNLIYFTDQMVAGLGGPKPFITGLGTDTNKNTLDDQKILFERSLKSLQEQISQTIVKEVFTRIAKDNNFNTIPTLVWEEISTESLDSKCDRLVKYVTSGLLVPDKDIRNIIRRSERLPKESDEVTPEIPKQEKSGGEHDATNSG